MTGVELVLAEHEATALAECEETIRRELSGFLAVGRALVQVREGRLYRAEFPTFEAYCHQRWDMGREHAFRLARAAQVADVLPVGNMPTSERQARELAPLLDQPDALREAWSQAVERTDGKPTAAALREAARPALATKARQEKRQARVRQKEQARRGRQRATSTAASVPLPMYVTSPVMRDVRVMVHQFEANDYALTFALRLDEARRDGADVWAAEVEDYVSRLLDQAERLARIVADDEYLDRVIHTPEGRESARQKTTRPLRGTR